MSPVKYPSRVLAVADHLAGEAHWAQHHADRLEDSIVDVWSGPDQQERRHALVDEAARYRVAADTLMDEALALLDAWEAGGRP